MQQKLPINSFKWVEETSQLMKISRKAITKIVMEGIFLKSMFNILKNYIAFKIIYVLSERMKIEKVEKLVANLHDKKEYA